MDRSAFLYSYLIIDEFDGKPVAEYDSNVCPPQIDSIIDLAEIKTRGTVNVYRVVSVRWQPLPISDDTMISTQTNIILIVEALEEHTPR